MPEKQTPIAIIDDHTLFRQGMISLLSEFPEITIVFDAANGEEMKSKITRYPLPEVILMDISMPVMDGYESTRWLREFYPDIKVLALSMFEEEKPIIKMLKNGAGDSGQTMRSALLFRLPAVSNVSFVSSLIVC